MAYDLIYHLNLAFILILGAITSYEDVKKNRISNKYIVSATIVAFLTNVVWNYLATAPWDTKLLYIQTTLLNACLCLLIGFLLWYLSVWRAADGKLFFAYAFLLPISTYYYGYTQPFPSFSILVNTLVPTFLILTLNLWVATSNDEKFGIVRTLANRRQLFYMLLSLLSVQWLFSILFKHLALTNDFLITGLFSTLLLLFLTNRFGSVLYEISIPLVLLRIILDYEPMLSINFIIQFLTLFALFVLLNFITNLGSFRFNERIKITELKPGMHCAEKIVRRGKLYVVSAPPTNEAEYLNINYENLTNDDIKKLRLLRSKDRLKCPELTVRQTLPFAPFLFMGVLLTILIRGDIITYSKLTMLGYVL